MSDRLHPNKDVWPTLDGQVYIAPGAKVIGDVTIGHGSGVWFNSVVRGDDTYIKIGRHTNIQDGTIIHVQWTTNPTIVGDYVTVGHNVILHGCTIGSNCIIGMGAIILTGAEIGDNCIIGAGAIVTEGRKISAGSLVVGAPGRVIRSVTDEEIAAIAESARHYHEKIQHYR